MPKNNNKMLIGAIGIIGVHVSFFAFSSVPWNDAAFFSNEFLSKNAENPSTTETPQTHDPTPTSYPPPPPGRPRIVILGSGWGAVSALKGLRCDSFDVVVISPRNYFLFTPLLPSASTGTLESRSLVEPIRRMAAKKGATYLEAGAKDIDGVNRLVLCEGVDGRKFNVPYDHLVVAVGASNNTFNTPGVREYAHFLKEIDHARKIRSVVLSNFEKAELPTTTREEKDRLLHFVVVGGGPTGVEFAAELNDFLATDVHRQYPHLGSHVRISLLDSGDHILNTYDKAISEYAEKQLAKQSINVVFNARVREVKETSVEFVDKHSGAKVDVPFGLCVWSTGIDAVDLTKSLVDKWKGEGQTNKRCLTTDSRMRVMGNVTDGRIYAIGDCATPEIPHLSQKSSEIFHLTNTGRDGILSLTDFRIVCEKVKMEIPIVAHFLKDPKKIFAKCAKKFPERGMDIEEFKAILVEAENSAKAYPATAQVAAQQGEYLAKRFNAMARDSQFQENSSKSPLSVSFKGDIPFVYRHAGSLAYVGGEKAVIDFGEHGHFEGWTAFWLWKSAYLSKQVSTRTRLALAFDWFKSYFFGRDSSNY